jgi:sarcosine oxidase subunit delta
VSEFRFGGERRAAPADELPDDQWLAQLYGRANVAGEQEEWWFHRFGCRRWFLARRDTRDNRVVATWTPGEAEPAR